MEVQFREVDPFNCWVWLRFAEIPSQGEKNYIDGIFDSWFVIGRLGGFNAQNLQANEESNELSWMHYENDQAQNILPALMHNVSQLEYQGLWARCWVDLGTSDALSLDVLINALRQVDLDIVRLSELFIGGVNSDWEVLEHPDAIFS